MSEEFTPLYECDNCGKKDVPLLDGLCIVCSHKRPKQGYKFSRQYKFIAQIKDLRSSEKRVASHIYSWPEGCWERNKEIAEVLSLHPRTVQKAVKVLREKKYIDYKPQKAGNSRILTFNIQKLIELEIPLFAEKAVAKEPVNNPAEEIPATPPGHRGIAPKA